MESTEQDTEQELIDIERARLAPYEAAATDPMWIWPLIGVLVFLYLASWSLETALCGTIATVLYCVGLLAILGHAARRRGVQPPLRTGAMPAPLRRELFVFWGLSALVAGAVVATQVLAGWFVAAAVAGVATALGGSWFQRRYRSRVADLVQHS